jgi:hypothetical protein
MKKSEEYLGSKNDRNWITLDHAKTYGKIVELECEIIRIKGNIKYLSTKIGIDSHNLKIKELESEIETLMKS